MSTIDIYRDAYNMAQDKRAKLTLDLIISADPQIKFSLEKAIEDCDKQIERLRTIIDECSSDPFLDIPSTVNPQELIEKKSLQSETPSKKCLKGKIDANLIIAVFLQNLSQRLVYIQPELYYQNPKNGDFCQKPVNRIGKLEDNDEDPFVIDKFPSRLEKLLSTAFVQLEELNLASDQFWNLKINLFVPLELLSLSLIEWCGTSEIIQNYPIIFGCSDRYNSGIEKSAELRNQLKRTWWERFQQDAPDESSQKLQSLKWVISDKNSELDLLKCSGLQCYGNWLRPGEQHLKYWAKLINSGIPIALWMCKNTPERAVISSIYQDLTNHTRFSFLDRLCSLRAEQQQNCDYHLGVLYEDPNSTPTESKLFSWPGTT